MELRIYSIIKLLEIIDVYMLFWNDKNNNILINNKTILYAVFFNKGYNL